MLRSPIHEHRLITLIVMSERAKKLVKRGDDDELRLIYDTYLGNTSYVNNWDLVDISCGPIVGGYLLDRDRSPLYELARSDLLWDRRIAMVGSQRFLRRGETSDLYRLAEILLPDRHDLIHKAVGWSLREAGKRVDADELRRFLDQYASTMPRTALRYAIEHFDACRAAALPTPFPVRRPQPVMRPASGDLVVGPISRARRVPGDITVERSGAVRK